MKHSRLWWAACLLAACSNGEDANRPEPAAEVRDEAELPFVVVTANPMATEAGAEVLRRGGSALDAAVAVQSVLGLVEPQSSGLAGGAFLLFYDASNGEVTAFDGRERAPLSTFPEVFYTEEGEPMGFYEAVTSGFSVGVPGAVAMLDTAHRKHGRLEWQELFGEAERLATEGFPVPQRMHDTMLRFRDFRAEPGAAGYVTEDGEPKPIGTMVTNPAYAETLQRIAEGGAAAFYTGPIAEAIIARVNEKTGAETLTLQDFADYRVEEREAVCAIVFERKICSMPPPSSGGVTMLQIAKLYEAKAGAMPVEDSLLAYIEASRLAYADRGRYLGDPTAMGTESLSAEDLTATLVSDRYLEGRGQLLGSAPAEDVQPGEPGGALMREGFLQDSSYELPSTSHFSIMDTDGNIVSMTTTIEFPFGSQMMAAGMVLNNQLTDFSRVPSENGRVAVNAPGPGKTPMSSMTPALLFEADGTPLGAIGSPGGPAIIGYVAKPLIDFLAAGVPLSEAALRPHVVVPRGTVVVEEGHSELADEVRALGYEVRESSLASGLYGFTISEDVIDPVVDPRREGSVVVGEE
ncbi:gamma-glutamyltransferase family protein [Parvularcula maris]|uniref:Gamma-glutamyltransferase family protein n=1 Tax=Parvularcula maris TaxID=2965077 RepID=A0A9X2RJX8_9PROT|nr:gamma-glutamyltransferase family protein [Parvularcula maris]MCQ8186376.1 gamma-glutamyltransferase family protein [Parvularcula maris]